MKAKEQVLSKARLLFITLLLICVCLGLQPATAFGDLIDFGTYKGTGTVTAEFPEHIVYEPEVYLTSTPDGPGPGILTLNQDFIYNWDGSDWVSIELTTSFLEGLKTNGEYEFSVTTSLGTTPGVRLIVDRQSSTVLTVFFSDIDDIVFDTQELKAGEHPVTPTPPPVPGKIFIGWMSNGALWSAEEINDLFIDDGDPRVGTQYSFRATYADAKPAIPATGDSALPIGIAALAILGGAGALIARRRMLRKQS